ncbi:MAG: SprT-like domain-containing protein [Planctomycetes bacterium]|nr:SprT-like domain-containing protein [Planctomycetota bacterium]
MLPTNAELESRVAELFAMWRVGERAIEVRWNERLSTSAGRAFVRRGRIELNPGLLAAHSDQIPVVLTHEAAHVAAWRLFGPAAESHGRQWRALMRLAGLPPAVTHDLPVERKPGHRRRRYLYLRVCDGCGERAILAAVRYGRCHGCSRRDSYLVLRAPATAAGRAALERMSHASVRERCAGSIMGDP